MKKDIEWLKREIPNLRGYAVVIDEIDGGLNPVTTISLKDVYRLINQLDEPEVTHEQVVEWIENNEFYCHATAETVLENAVDKGELGYYGTKYSVVEKPVIPKYVADWWERDGDSVTLYGGLQVKKKHKFGLISNFHDKGLGDYLSRVEDWLDENKSIFLELVNGKPYEVDEEPMYQALIKGHEVADGYDIYWNCDKSDRGVFVSRLHPLDDNFITEMSKEAWNELGIDDSNADLIKVEE